MLLRGAALCVRSKEVIESSGPVGKEQGGY